MMMMINNNNNNNKNNNKNNNNDGDMRCSRLTDELQMEVSSDKMRK